MFVLEFMLLIVDVSIDTSYMARLKEEDEYWKTHSPLDEGYEGEIQETKQNRSSFLSVRLTGEELSLLKDLADNVGMKPSTFVRQLLIESIKKNNGMPHTARAIEPREVFLMRE